MKKTLLTAAAAFIALAAVSGCSSEETPSANAGILDATAAVESFTGVTEINMTASSDGNKISMGTTGNISLKAEPFFADMALKIALYCAAVLAVIVITGAGIYLSDKKRRNL